MIECEIRIISKTNLTEQETETILAVSMALYGVRMDLQLQDIVDVVVGLREEGQPWDTIGLTLLSATKAAAGAH